VDGIEVSNKKIIDLSDHLIDLVDLNIDVVIAKVPINEYSKEASVKDIITKRTTPIKGIRNKLAIIKKRKLLKIIGGLLIVILFCIDIYYELNELFRSTDFHSEWFSTDIENNLDKYLYFNLITASIVFLILLIYLLIASAITEFEKLRINYKYRENDAFKDDIMWDMLLEEGDLLESIVENGWAHIDLPGQLLEDEELNEINEEERLEYRRVYLLNNLPDYWDSNTTIESIGKPMFGTLIIIFSLTFGLGLGAYIRFNPEDKFLGIYYLILVVIAFFFGCHQYYQYQKLLNGFERHFIQKLSRIERQSVLGDSDPLTVLHILNTRAKLNDVRQLPKYPISLTQLLIIPSIIGIVSSIITYLASNQ
jgi:hypothetical protein